MAGIGRQIVKDSVRILLYTGWGIYVPRGGSDGAGGSGRQGIGAGEEASSFLGTPETDDSCRGKDRGTERPDGMPKTWNLAADVL